MRNKIQRDFFERDPVIVAKELLGYTFVHKTDRGEIAGIITETEAYGDASDLASHARFASSTRNKIMFGPAGRLYIYSIYGIHNLTNIVTGEEGSAGAVLIRSAEIISGKNLASLNLAKSKFVKNNEQLATGPGKFSLAFDINNEENETDLTTSPEFFILKREGDPTEIVATKRVGIDYAQHAKDWPWRFYINDSGFVSKK